MNQISDKSLNLTETAVSRIKTAMKANDDLGSKFRVYVTGGGCSGFQYGFKFDSDVAFDDDVIQFDNFSILLKRDQHVQLVYKHAISTIMPVSSVNLQEYDDEGCVEDSE